MLKFEKPKDEPENEFNLVELIALLTEGLAKIPKAHRGTAVIEFIKDADNGYGYKIQF